MAAAILASVGTFAVADGEGEGGCGDGICGVGTVLDTSIGLVSVGHAENFSDSWSASWSGIVAGRDDVTGNTTDGEGSTGNCSGEAGESGTNGCND